MDIEVFSFPTLTEENSRSVEVTFCKLINAYRNGEPLTPEMIDWLDTANTWLEAH